ncbi:hypothetical protein C5167_028052 [Papaver somniferum]|nr:hypothetical protein C5167_028052 [Papaver somniferum]
MPMRNLIPQLWMTYQFVQYIQWRRQRVAAKCRWKWKSWFNRYRGGFKVSIELAMDVAMDLHPNENQRIHRSKFWVLTVKLQLFFQMRFKFIVWQACKLSPVQIHDGRPVN